MGLSLPSAPDFQSFATLSSDGYWNVFGNLWPVLVVSPGQSKDYDLILYLNQNSLPKTGVLRTVNTSGLEMDFSKNSFDLSSGAVFHLNLTLKLSNGFPRGVSMLVVPMVFSDSSRIQPISFGPIYLVTGFAGQSITGGGSTGQPYFAFEDSKGRGYLVNMLALATGTSVLSMPNSVCMFLDESGALTTSSVGANSYCNLGGLDAGPLQLIALKTGQTTSLNFSLSLSTSLGVYLSFYYIPPPGSPYSMSLSPPDSALPALKQGQILQVKLSITGGTPGIGSDMVQIVGFALDGSSGNFPPPVYSFPIIVVVSS
jgi:hypothetical protein